MAFMAAWVPTGMKMGVSMTPWGVEIRPRRARVVLSVAMSEKAMLMGWPFLTVKGDSAI
jgi:hypothetical protein